MLNSSPKVVRFDKDFDVNVNVDVDVDVDFDVDISVNVNVDVDVDADAFTWMSALTSTPTWVSPCESMTEAHD